MSAEAEVQRDPVTPSTRYSGRIMRWGRRRGFGFIEMDQEGLPAVFLHVTDCGGIAPPNGARVTFLIGVDGRGRRKAIAARLIEDGQ